MDSAAIRACFAGCFVGAGPAGVTCGANDDSFAASLATGYVFYRKIGTRRMVLRGVEPTPIDRLHHLVKVLYRADYRKPDDTELSIDFDVSYILQARDGVPKIFAFITGDEMGLYKQHGLLPD